jgi:hypothetical protein
VINLGSILVGNATLVVANVLTCNNHSKNAVRAGHDAVVQLLLRNGADPQLRIGFHYTALYLAARNGHTSVVQLLLEAWGQPQITAADLVAAAKAAAAYSHQAEFAQLAGQLQKLYPEEIPQLLEGEIPIPAGEALAAMLSQWVSEVSSIDEQRAAVLQREVGVASEKRAVQQLIVGMAGMAKQAQGDTDDKAQ